MKIRVTILRWLELRVRKQRDAVEELASVAHQALDLSLKSIQHQSQLVTQCVAQNLRSPKPLMELVLWVAILLSLYLLLQQQLRTGS